MEAAHISWRPLGQLLLDEGLLTSEQLEEALDKQATTGRRLGEIAVELGFVSHMALSRVLSAQYGVELESEDGFGTGLRAELARREGEGEPPVPGPDFIVALPPLELAPPPPPTRDERLRDLESELDALRQTSEYGHEQATRLSEALLAREGELEVLRQEVRRRHQQAAKFAARMRALQRETDERGTDSHLLEAMRDAHEYRHAQAVRFATGLRARDARLMELEQSLTELRVAADEARIEREHTDREAELLAEAVHERDTQLAHQRGTYERRQSQAAKFATRLRTREAELTYERASLGEALAEIETISHQLADLHQAAIDERAEATKFSELVGTRDRELAELQDELASVRHGADDGHNEAARLAEILGARDHELGEVRNELESLRNGAQDGHAEAARLADELGQRQAELAERDGWLADRERELAELREAIARAKEHDESDQLAEALSHREAELAEREHELAGLRESANRSEEDATRLAEELSHRESELAELREAIARAEAHDDSARLAEALRHREAELAQRDHELAELREAANRTEEDASRLAEEVRGRDGLVAALHGEISALKESTDHGLDEAGQLAEALSARDGQLAARERELAELHEAYSHRHDQAARFARRLRQEPVRTSDDHSVGYLVLAQFARRYALVERGGALPAPDATFELPDVGRGLLRVVRVGPSPLPNDARSCVFTEYVPEPV